MSAFGAPAEATVEYGSSSIYFKSDMDSAIALIQDTFASLEGCELYTIRYFFRTMYATTKTSHG
ncbi:MAG: hypothetical protein ACOYKJ_08230 [Candidatus Howiella sp.]